MKRMHVFTLLTATFVSVSSAAGAAATPIIFYSDLQSGPNSGGQNNQGVFVSIYGAGFGSLQGNSTVTIGGGSAAAYPLWSDHKIIFQVGAQAVSGSIVVHTNGVRSNGVRFTVRPGNIYFVSPTGNDSANGSYSSPWQTLTQARSVVVPGDTVYLMDGLQQSGLDSNNASLTIGTKGLGANPIALVAYPGANVTIGSATGSSYGLYATNSPYWVISGIHIQGSAEALHLSGSSAWRVVGNDLTCPNAVSRGGCLNGTNSGGAKIYGNTIRDSGLAGTALPQYDSMVFTDSSGLDIGWNEIARTNGCNAVHAIGVRTTPTNLSIHDNWIHDSVCTGILLARISTVSPVKIFNNVLARLGTGPSPGGASTFACISVGGASTNAVQIDDNTFHDCGAGSGTQSGALDISIPITVNDNILDMVGGELYVSAASVLSEVTGSNDLFNGGGPPPSMFSAPVIQDPQLVDPIHDNYQLQNSSPAIDAGITTGIAHDILGVPRPQGAAYDIGAYEYDGATTGNLEQLQASPSALNFGSVSDGSNSTLSVNLTNSGVTPVTLVQSTINGAGFTTSGPPPSTTIAPGASLAVQVTFAPSNATNYSGTLTITTDASNPSLIINLSGTGQSQPGTLSANPASIVFGNVNTGATTTQTIQMTNTGPGSASISQISITGAGFSVSGLSTPYSLPAGATASVSITFSPTSTTSYSGILTITSDASNSTLSIPLSGAGTQPPQAQLSAVPAILSFGNVNAGSSSAQTVMITNSGNASATISQVSAAGTGFSTGGAPTTPYTLAAGATLSLSVTFTPTAVNSYSGSLTVTSDASNFSLSIPLSGIGTQPPKGQLAVSPASVNFGTVNAGATSTQSLTITNSGNASATISQLSESGAGFSVMGISSPYTLAAGSSVTMSITFAPTATTSYSGSLILTSDASNSQLAIPLSGTGAQAPQGQLAANTTAVNFGAISAGNSATQAVTLTNTGNADVSITELSAVGSGFAVSGIAVPYRLASGASATLQISYAPALAGTYGGTLVITSDAPNSPLSISLMGTATHSVGLSWTDGDPGIAGYNVYRATQSGGPYTILNSALIGASNWNDGSVQNGQTYYYVLTAVDTSGNESGYSPEVSVTIPNQ